MVTMLDTLEVDCPLHGAREGLVVVKEPGVINSGP